MFLHTHRVFNAVHILSVETMGGVYQELGGAKHPHGRSKVLILMM